MFSDADTRRTEDSTQIPYVQPDQAHPAYDKRPEGPSTKNVSFLSPTTRSGMLLGISNLKLGGGCGVLGLSGTSKGGFHFRLREVLCFG